MESATDSDAGLCDEALRFGQYLLGCDPGQELAERYARAHAMLFTEPPSSSEVALIEFCRKHPRSVPYLDAAAGVFAPQSLLRKKLLVLSAVLETTPRFADRFLPEPSGTGTLVVKLTALIATAAFRFLVGAALWPLARRHG